jgi:hypothetical protein
MGTRVRTRRSHSTLPQICGLGYPCGRCSGTSWMRSGLLTIGTLLVSAVCALSQTVRSLPILTRASQIRELTPEQAAQGYPVHIRGVVTVDVPSPDFFVQDSTAGVYVEGNRSPAFPHTLGQLIELEGVTGPGKFAPVIKERTLRVLGKGTLPTARVYSFGELADGQLDSQWAGVRGIVRSVSIDRTSWRELTLAMHVASGGGEFNVRVPIPHEQDFSSWVDSEVLIEGVCAETRFHQGRNASAGKDSIFGTPAVLAGSGLATPSAGARNGRVSAAGEHPLHRKRRQGAARADATGHLARAGRRGRRFGVPIDG